MPEKSLTARTETELDILHELRIALAKCDELDKWICETTRGVERVRLAHQLVGVRMPIQRAIAKAEA